MKKTSVETQSIFFTIFVCLVFLLGFGSRTVAAQSELQVEPGLKIPNAETPWAVDVFENQRQLVPLHHFNDSTLPVDRYADGNTKHTTELDGLNSRNQLHFDRPVLYVNHGLYDFFISRVEQKKEKRFIDQLASTQLKENEERTAESFVETKTTAMGDGWMRVEPIASMPEGEYVLLAIPKVRRATYSQVVVVWLDFGIHGNAPNVKDAIQATSQIKGN
jgi:hypothetical protein